MPSSPLEFFMEEHKSKLIITQEQIAQEIERLAEEIMRDHPGREIVLVAVLKGAFLFVSDLARRITSPVLVDFVRLASYGSETSSSGIVEFRKDLEISIKGRDVVIVEDIIDSGHTLETLYHKLLLREPRSLKVCTLIDKKSRREVDMQADYVGITLDDGFIVGYGLDYDEKYRNLPDIYLIENA